MANVYDPHRNDPSLSRTIKLEGGRQVAVQLTRTGTRKYTATTNAFPKWKLDFVGYTSPKRMAWKTIDAQIKEDLEKLLREKDAEYEEDRNRTPKGVTADEAESGMSKESSDLWDNTLMDGLTEEDEAESEETMTDQEISALHGGPPEHGQQFELSGIGAFEFTIGEHGAIVLQTEGTAFDGHLQKTFVGEAQAVEESVELAKAALRELLGPGQGERTDLVLAVTHAVLRGEDAEAPGKDYFIIRYDYKAPNFVAVMDLRELNHPVVDYMYGEGDSVVHASDSLMSHMAQVEAEPATDVIADAEETYAKEPETSPAAPENPGIAVVDTGNTGEEEEEETFEYEMPEPEGGRQWTPFRTVYVRSNDEPAVHLAISYELKSRKVTEIIAKSAFVWPTPVDTKEDLTDFVYEDKAYDYKVYTQDIPDDLRYPAKNELTEVFLKQCFDLVKEMMEEEVARNGAGLIVEVRDMRDRLEVGRLRQLAEKNPAYKAQFQEKLRQVAARQGMRMPQQPQPNMVQAVTEAQGKAMEQAIAQQKEQVTGRGPTKRGRRRRAKSK